MGGIGSGRRSGGGKDTTDDHRSFDVRRLQRGGLLAPGTAFALNWTRNGDTVASVDIRTKTDRLVLNYRHKSRGSDWQPMEYAVPLDWTSCTLGGRRAWFRCPAIGCGRRVALLYIGDAGVFACRHCYRLAYGCQRESAGDRAHRRANAIRRRLGWPVGILHPPGGKPKGMHWRTFARLSSTHHAFAMVALDGFGRRIGMVGRQLAGVHDVLNGKR